MTDSNGDNGYPRVLDEKGCLHGRGTRDRVDELAERMKELEKKIDRLIWALTAASVSFATAVVLLALNLLRVAPTP